MKTKDLKSKQKAQPGGSLKPVGSEAELSEILERLFAATKLDNKQIIAVKGNRGLLKWMTPNAEVSDGGPLTHK